MLSLPDYTTLSINVHGSSILSRPFLFNLALYPAMSILSSCSMSPQPRTKPIYLSNLHLLIILYYIQLLNIIYIYYLYKFR